MATGNKIKYKVMEYTPATGSGNKHSFYAKFVKNGTMNAEQLFTEAFANKNIDPDTASAAFSIAMKKVLFQLAQSYRVQFGDYLTLYPIISKSIKDGDIVGGEAKNPVEATDLSVSIDDVTVGCTVSTKLSELLRQSGSIQKVSGVEQTDEDENGGANEESEGGSQGGTTPSQNGENNEP